MKNKLQSKISKKPKVENKSYFQLLITFGSTLIGVVTILVICIILMLISMHVYRASQQNKKFSQAQELCGRDPVVVIESIGWFDTKSYDIYSPENPEYKTVKNTVSDPFNQSSVFGYYCSMADTNKIIGNDNKVSNNESNYTSEEKQKIINDYIIKQTEMGIKFYAPTNQMKGFRENVKVITPEVGLYNIGYVGNTSETQGRGEQVPINLNCKITQDRGTIGDLVDTHPNGGGIYLEETVYNLNVRYYLPSVICSLETETGELNSQDAVNLMKSITEVDPSQIETYELNLY